MSIQCTRTKDCSHSIDSHQERDQGSRKVDQAVLEMDQRDLGGGGLALRHCGGQRCLGRNQLEALNSRLVSWSQERRGETGLALLLLGKQLGSRACATQAGRSGYGCGTRSRNCNCDCHVPRLMGDSPAHGGSSGPLPSVVQGFCRGAAALLGAVSSHLQSQRKLRLFANKLFQPSCSPTLPPRSCTRTRPITRLAELAVWTRRAWRLENQFEPLLPNSSPSWHHLCPVSDSDGFATLSAPPTPHPRP